MVLPFSVFYRSDRHTYYVAFKNEETGRYLPAISTKKTKETDAVRQAWIWFREGVPHKGRTLDLKAYSLRDSIRYASISLSDAEFIIDELKRRNLVKSCVFAGAVDSISFTDFLKEFWDWDRSPYIREKLRAEHSIHRNYVVQMSIIVKNYWLPFFSSKLLGDLHPEDLDDFVDHLSEVRHGKNNSHLSNVRKNGIIKTGIIPLRWAYKKRKIEFDVTRNLIFFSNNSAERIILTPQQATSIFNQEWEDLRSKVANMTAMVTGLRAGELQGLQASDLGESCLMIRHSWNRCDKLKTTKNNAQRIVELPFPLLMQSLKYIAELNPHGFNPNSYVFWSSRSAKKPMEQRLFVTGLRSSLIALGLNNDTANSFSFHGWRHFFTSYMRDKIEDKLLQSQTGHKTISMLDHYSSHRLPGDRDKIRDAQREVFSSLLPSG